MARRPSPWPAWAGGFILADPGLFDPPDINRQWAATRDTLGRNKAEVYAEVLRSIDAGVRVRSYSEGLTDDNVETFLDGADVVIDCLDIAVPGELRARLYQAARARGIHALCAPALGFGAALAIGAPDGLPMEAVFGKVLGEATARSTLPPGLRQLVVPEHLDACERHLSSLRVPSIAISPALASALMSAEIYLLLSGPQAPGWRPPPCLPQLLVVDPIRMTYQVVDIRDLAGPPAAPPPVPQPPQVPQPPPWRPRVPRPACRRGTWRKPSANCDARGWPRPATTRTCCRPTRWRSTCCPTAGASEPRGTGKDAPAPIPADGLEHRLAELYGYPHNLPVFRGRFAEALLAETLIQPGRTVVCNALFPTTRYHLAARGATLLELGIAAAHASQDPHPFKGDLDLDALGAALAGGDVQAVYVELCANTLGGHPISLANLRAAGRLAAAAGIPLLLDATRAWENAALIRDREPGQSGGRWGISCASFALVPRPARPA